MDQPVFVVGPTRSGTDLMRDILTRHQSISIAAETHYFDDIRTTFESPSDVRVDAADAVRLEDYFLALTHRSFGHAGEADKGWMSRTDLRERANELGGSADSYFEAYVELVAKDDSVTVLGEMTPRHVFRIDDIVERYPDARIVAMMRDPRAVTASYRDWQCVNGVDLERDPDYAVLLEDEMLRARRSYHPVLMATLWRGQAGSMLKAREQHGPQQVKIVKYEALIANPRSAVDELCDWLGVPFNPDMVGVVEQESTSLRSRRSRGVLRDGAERWRTRLDNTEIALIQSVTRSRMIEAGYRPERVERELMGYSKSLASFPFATARGINANRDRLGRPVEYFTKRLKSLR